MASSSSPAVGPTDLPPSSPSRWHWLWPDAPRSIQLAVVLAVVEAVAFGVFTVWSFASGFPVPDPVATRLTMAVGATLIQLLIVGALAAAARGLAGLHHWPRAVLVVVQLFAILVAIPIARDGVVIGWLVCVVAAALLVALMWPSTTRAIEFHGEPPTL